MYGFFMSLGQLDLFAPTPAPAPTKLWYDLPFLCVDTETTGLEAKLDRVIEIAWLHFDNQKLLTANSALCKISVPLPGIITRITGINDEMLVNEKPFDHYTNDLLNAFEKAAFIVAYNAPFDKAFIDAEFARVGKSLPEKKWIDPLVFVKEIDKFKKGKKLADAAARWGVSLNGAHRATADAQATGELLFKLAPQLKYASIDELYAQQKKWAGEHQKSFDAYRQRKS